MAVIDHYCRQPKARSRQFPWIALSAAAYLEAFGLAVAQLGNIGPSVIALGLAILCMAIAGRFAPDDPHMFGQHEVIAYIRCYDAHDAKAHEELVWKMMAKTWTVADLVAFLVLERRAEEFHRRP
jgi:hypothetical protein